MDNMKLLDVHIENFKSLKKLDVKLSDKVSLLVGKNNSGKSNFIEALLFLPKIIKKGSRDEDFKRIMYGKDTSNELIYELTFQLSEDEKSEFISYLNASDAKKREIDRSLGSKVKYMGRFGIEKKILEEAIYIYFKDREVKLSKGIWEENTYNYFILDFINFFGSYDRIESDLTRRKLPKNSTLEKSPLMDSTAKSILQYPLQSRQIRPEEYLLKFIMDFLDKIHQIGPNRTSNEVKTIKGDFKLRRDGENLPEVLHSLASSNRKCFDRIAAHTKEIIENISEIKTPIIEGEQRIYIALTEKPFGNIEYTWNNMSSGIKEILFLTTLLDSSEKGSLLMIEEPEIHLHGDAIRRFINILSDVIKTDDKQVIMTTHSSTFIDLLSQENLFCVVKERGNTEIIPLSHEVNFEEMLLKAGLSKSDLFISRSPSLIIIVEGRDDVKIFNQFLVKEGTDPKIEKINIVTPSEKGGGSSEVIKFGKMLKRTRIEIPFLIILDSDRRKEKKEQEMKNEGFRNDEYFILEKEEIEEYLIDSNAISKIARKPSAEIREIISGTKGTGKEKLGRILKRLGIQPNSEIKALIVRHLESTPKEISDIIALVRTRKYS